MNYWCLFKWLKRRKFLNSLVLRKINYFQVYELTNLNNQFPVRHIYGTVFSDQIQNNDIYEKY